MRVTVTVQARQSSHAMTRKTIEQESNGVARARAGSQIKNHEEAAATPTTRGAGESPSLQEVCRRNVTNHCKLGKAIGKNVPGPWYLRDAEPRTGQS